MDPENPQVSLQQWRTLCAVVEAGGIHRGAQRIGRSHSAVSQALSRLEALVGGALLEPDGRGVRPTALGQALAKRAARLLAAAGALEAFAESRQAGWESALRVALDAATPNGLVTEALARWGPLARGTSVALVRVIAESAEAAGRDPGFDLVLSAALAPGVTPLPVAVIPFKLVVHPGHPLARRMAAGAGLELDAILAAPQVVVGAELPDGGDGWRAGLIRWTVPDFELARVALETRIPFALLPSDRVAADLAAGALVELPAPVMDTSRQLHLIHPRGGRTGPAAQALAGCFLAAGRAAAGEAGAG